MSDSAVYLTERILPEVPMRQWVCSMPWGLRALIGYDRALCAEVVNAFVEELLRSLRRRAKRLFGFASVERAFPGAVTFIQRFDSALRLNMHVHTLALDGVYVREDHSMAEPVFRVLPAPTADEVLEIAKRTAKRVVAALKKRGRTVEGLWDDGSTVDDSDPALVACYGVAAHASALRMVEGGRPRNGERPAVVMGFDIHAGAVSMAAIAPVWRG